jgi:TFIIF-interacting CTD phosphatase-like protein
METNSGLILLKPCIDSAFQVNLVIDLDETLVHSIFSDKELQQLEKLDNFLLRLHVTQKEKHSYIYSYYRPFLKEFLKSVEGKFNIILYSMGSREYIEQVVAAINIKFDMTHVFHRIISRENFKDLGYKSLDYMMIPSKDTIIIDDREDVWVENKSNLLLIKKFVVCEIKDNIEIYEYCHDKELDIISKILSKLYADYINNMPDKRLLDIIMDYKTSCSCIEIRGRFIIQDVP